MRNGDRTGFLQSYCTVICAVIIYIYIYISPESHENPSSIPSRSPEIARPPFVSPEDLHGHFGDLRHLLEDHGEPSPGPKGAASWLVFSPWRDGETELTISGLDVTGR